MTHHVDHLEGPVLQMILDDLKQVKNAVDLGASETREEFRRLRDKLDRLERDMSRDLTGHAVDISQLQTKAKGIAAIAGSVAGFITSLIAVSLGAMLKYFIDTGS
jgi:hypothetical protein